MRITHRDVFNLKRALKAKPQASADGSYAPRCHLCNRNVSSEAIVEIGKTFAVVLVRHHDAEAVARFDMGREVFWDDDARDPHAYEDLNRLMRGHKWFDPAEFAGQAPVTPDDGQDIAFD